ncbi:MAG: oligosaccharide flippase family protein [Calditrichota bacterium]
MANKKIGKLAKIGALWTTGSRLGYYVIFIGTSIVLARILTPEEFGLMVVVNLTTVFVKHFFEFGLSYAFIQEKEVNQDDASTFFFMQLGLNVVIWLAVCAVAPFAADYYDQPQLVYFLPVNGFGYVIDSLNRVPMTMMARELDYRLNSMIGLIAALFFILNTGKCTE